MAQHDYNIANQSGQAFRADLNNALAAIVSNNSGAAAPSTTYAYQYWVDTSTTPATLKQRNSSNNAWITIGLLDTTNLGLIPAGTGSIVNADVNASAGIVASKLSFTQAGTGAAARTIDSKLKDFVSTADFGIPGDLTDDGSNHTRLKNAAIAAIAAKVPLLVVGRILVSDTVDWDTSGASYGGGVGKSLTIIGDATGGGAETGSGIYGNAASFQGTSKKVVNYKAQNRSEIRGLAFKLYQPAATYTYTSLANVTQLWAQSTDRCLIRQCSIGGLARPGATDIGAGVALQFDDCMSCRVENCDIQYVSKKGIDYSATGGASRTGTSFVITGCHFSVGNPGATSRNDCEALDLSGTQAWFIAGCIFENNNKGRAVRMDGEHSVIRDCWFEGNYDTILIAGGIGHVIRDNYGIGYNPALSYIEGYGSYTPPGGVLAIGTSDATALANTSITYANFYQKQSQAVGPQTVKGQLNVDADIRADLLRTYKSGSGINVVLGATTAHSSVTNDQTHLIIDHYAGNVAGWRLANAGTVKVRAFTNVNDANNGLVLSLADTRRFLFQDSDGSRDIYYMKHEYFQSGADNVAKLGDSGYRWSTVYAATGSINTSDEREKQDISELDDAERRVAAAIKGLIKKFRFRDAVQEKGDDARIHVGVITQEVVAAFQAEGLDPMRYGIVCYDQWDEQEEITEEVLDEDGQPTGEVVTVQRYRPAGDRYGIRYEELLAFVLAAL